MAHEIVPAGSQSRQVVFPAIRILETEARPAAMAVEIAVPLRRREYDKAIDRE